MRGSAVRFGWILALGFAAAATAGEAPREAFADAPAAWKDYFVRAQAAVKLQDPLQRCLAFPDLPGNAWPEGHAAAHCRNHFALEEVPAAEIRAALDAGGAVALDARLQALLERHFDRDDPREDIHYVFDALRDAGPDMDALSRQWLRQAPDSAYAHLARAVHLDSAAWAARGGKYAAETPAGNLRRMSEIAGQAVLMYERAVEIEPRLMPAHEGLLRMATMDSRDDVAAEAIRAAERWDPACLSVARERMRALEPRWGGSYPEMFGYAQALQALQARRPAVAMYVGAPFADSGDVLSSDDAHAGEAMQALDLAVRLGSAESYLKDAANAAFTTDKQVRDTWKAYAYLLQAERFSEQNAWVQRTLAGFLVRRDPAWALRHAERAVQAEPADALGRYLLGAAYNNSRRHEEAQAQYLLAAEDAGQRQEALREMSAMWLYDSGLPPRQRSAKALPHLQRLMKEYPADGRGWIMHAQERALAENHIDESLLQTALEKADPDDPWQAHFIRSLQELRARRPVEAPRPPE